MPARPLHAAIHRAWAPPVREVKSCVIIHCGWSAWEWVLSFLGFQVLGDLNLHTASFDKSQYKSNIILFCSGPWSSLQPIWDELKVEYHMLLALDYGSRPKFSQGTWWHFLKHKDCDGVTTGGWWCGASRRPLTQPTPMLSVRRLRHILCPMNRGKPVPSPSAAQDVFETAQWTPDGYHPGGLLPLHKGAVRVLAPSVFQGWVSRRLTRDELFQCLDVPNEQIKETLEEHLVRPSTPGKVLLSYANCFERARAGCAMPPVMPMPESILSLSMGAEANAPLTEVPTQQPGLRQRAAKADDAAINTNYWDDPFWEKWQTWGRDQAFLSKARHAKVGKSCTPVLDLFRGFQLRVWRRSVYRSFRRFMRSTHGSTWFTKPPNDLNHGQDLEAGRDCLARCAEADFWEWLGGSRLFFWRWPKPLRDWARDGHPVYLFRERLPQYTRGQPRELDLSLKTRVTEKLNKFIKKGYLVPGSVSSLIKYFTVPKGDTDVRVVFDGTKSGLNNAMWAPTFTLPTVDSLLPMLEPGTWQGDIDVGEMFYNYLLHPDVRAFCGVDINPYFKDDQAASRLAWLLWIRCVMGLKSSPHGCVKMQALAEEIVRGHAADTANPFYYDLIRLNLPGQASYDPSLPWFSKVDSRTGRIAADMVTYVDDVRTTGADEQQCRDVCHRVSSRFCYLGIQDALRKRAAPSPAAGAWTGSLAQTDDGSVSVSCTQEKWEKARSYILDIQAHLTDRRPFHFKTLEQQRGFLVYITRTYPSLVPYLKGIHLTLDSWRPNRDDEGWKLHQQVHLHLDEVNHDDALPASTCHPPTVMPVPRLRDDIKGLLTLFSSTAPPKRIIRSNAIAIALYGFGDASGSGFGDTVISPLGIHYRYGIWGNDLSSQSSNYRELFNLTEAMEDHVATLRFPHLASFVQSVESDATRGLLTQAEMFLFTDNAVAEGAFYKGTSTNKQLFELVLRLKKLEFDHRFRLHVIHIAGTRMQAQGTDALSRGSVLSLDMLHLVPLHLSAKARSPNVSAWCISWLSPAATLVPLSERDWFYRGHGLGEGSENPDGLWMPTPLPDSHQVFGWFPPPAIGDIAIEQLSLSRHKRPNLTHIFVCPRLMTHLWRKKLYRHADLVFTLPVGARSTVWPSSMFEPLIVGIFLPFLSVAPWSRRNTDQVLDVASQLSSMWASPQGDERSILRQLWDVPGGEV